MTPVLLPRLLRIALATAIGLLPLAPPAHVHEATDADGHHEAVAHRHLEPHHVHARAHHDHDRAALDEDESVVATLDPAYISPNAHAPTVPTATVAVFLPDVTAETRVVPFEFVERLIHGPPRGPTSLRAPPAQSLL